MSRYNPKPSVDLKNRELRAYLVESYIEFGLLAQDIIAGLKSRGVTEPYILDAVCQAVVNQPVVYRVQEFYARPTELTAEQALKSREIIDKLTPQIGKKVNP